MTNQSAGLPSLVKGYTVVEQIGQGGFGRVYTATSPEGETVVLKYVPKTPNSARELLFEGLSGDNIIPIQKTIELNSEYVLVMPKADYSLRSALADAGGRFSEPLSLQVLRDITLALASLSGRVVHRDLKPENVLFWNGRWCLADFGISRYAEAATGAVTHKMMGTSEYVAPERFRHERATTKSDIYSLGIMAFEILEGRVPFPQNSLDYPDTSYAHINLAPPSMTTGSSPYRALVLDCLSKAPDARPAPDRLLSRLNGIQTAPAPGLAALQAANLQVAQGNASASAESARAVSAASRRQDLTKAATDSLSRIVEEMRDTIETQAPTAIISTTGVMLEVRLGKSILQVTLPRSVTQNKAQIKYGELPFSVMAESTISIINNPAPHGYRGRQHSLWFSDLESENEFRWYELAFHVMWGDEPPFVPFALESTNGDAVGAILPMMHTYQVARTPVAIDQGDHQEFLERWMGWLAASATGNLGRPRTMPEDNGVKNWRR